MPVPMVSRMSSSTRFLNPDKWRTGSPPYGASIARTAGSARAKASRSSVQSGIRTVAKAGSICAAVMPSYSMRKQARETLRGPGGGPAPPRFQRDCSAANSCSGAAEGRIHCISVSRPRRVIPVIAT